MVNIPSNLQAIWNEVSKDGKIDKADRQKLLTEAQSKDGINNEEQDFLKNFESLTTSETSIDVKNGNATGTFEFVDSVKFPSQAKTQDNSKYYPSVTLGGNPTKPEDKKETPKVETPKTEGSTESTDSNSEVTPTQPESPSAPVSTGLNAQEQKQLEDLKKMRDTIKSQLQNPNDPNKINLEKQLQDLDTKIKTLEDKSKTSPTEKPTAPTNTAPSTEIKKEIEILNNLYALKKNSVAQSEIKLIDEKISKAETKIKNTMLDDIKGLTGRIASPDFNKDRDTIKANYNSLPDSLKNDPQIKAGIDSISNVTPKQKLFAEINDVIGLATQEAMKTGDMHKFTIAKNEIQRLVDKNPELAGDEQVKKIISILNGSVPTEKSGNYVYRTIDTIKTANKLIDKPNWTKADYAKAKELLSEKNDKTSKEGENFFIDGPFRSRLEARVGSFDTNRASEKEKNQKTTIKGIDDVLGNGFLNAKNKEGVSAIFQSLAAQNELESTLKRMKSADQIKAMKMLSESQDKFDLAIAKKIYDNLSNISNVDDELKPALRDKIKNFKPEEMNKYPVNENSFFKGLQYSLYSEKEAAMTMVRSLIDGNVSSKVLNRFSKEEMGMMKDLVNKQGTASEKEELLTLIGSNYAKGDSPNIEHMSDNEKAQVIKLMLDNENIDESKLDDLVNKAGNKAVTMAVNNNSDINDKQLALLAKHSDGDSMTNEPSVASRMLSAMIREFNKEGQSYISVHDINKFIDEIKKDWFDDDQVMKQVLSELGDGPNSEYAKFSNASPATLHKIRLIAEKK